MGDIKVTNFDKEMLKKHKDSIMKKLGESDKVNLSDALTRIIGYSYSKANFEGFFYWDTHEDSFNEKDRNRAQSKILSLCAIDSQFDSSSIFGDYVQCTNRADRDLIRNKNLSINKDNIKDLFGFESLGTCKGSKGGSPCGKEWGIETSFVADNFDFDETCLYLPKTCIVTKMTFILEGIVQHSICDHPKKKRSGIAEIELDFKNIGNNVECLFLIIVKEPKNSKYNTNKNPVTSLFVKSGLWRYCDYLILAPGGDDKYKVTNLASKYSGGEVAWRELDRGNVSVRFNSKRLTDEEIRTELITPSPDRVLHVLVFNNHQKINETGGAEDAMRTA